MESRGNTGSRARTRNKRINANKRLKRSAWFFGIASRHGKQAMVWVFATEDYWDYAGAPDSHKPCG